MINNDNDHFEELLASALALKERATDQSFVDAVALSIAEEERFRQNCRAYVRSTFIDAAMLLAFGGMFAVLLHAGMIEAVFETYPSLLLPVALGVGMLIVLFQRPYIGSPKLLSR